MKNHSSSTDEKEKEAEKRSSATAESEKTTKIGFRPWPMSKKQQKQTFGHGRKLQNGKYCVSATADELKTAKADFRPRPKPHCLPTLTHGREQSNLGIASESSNCRFIKQHPYSQRNLKSSEKYLYMSGKNANIATENGQRTLVRSPTALSTERNIFGKWNR